MPRVIKDKNTIEDICGNLLEGDTAEINDIIREGKLSDCR